MAVKSELMRNDRVLLITYSDPLDMNEIWRSAEANTRDFLSKANKPIHSIADFSGVTRLPSNVLSGTLRITKMGMSHPMAGHSVVVAPNTFVNLMATTLSRLARGASITVRRTLDEAWKEIDRILEAEQPSV